MLAAPNVSTAQRLGAAPAAIETAYQSEHAWALREIVSDINEIARYRVKRPEPPAFAEPIALWQPELLTAYAATQLQPSANVKLNENDPLINSQLLDFRPMRSSMRIPRLGGAEREMRNPARMRPRLVSARSVCANPRRVCRTALGLNDDRALAGAKACERPSRWRDGSGECAAAALSNRSGGRPQSTRAPGPAALAHGNAQCDALPQTGECADGRPRHRPRRRVLTSTALNPPPHPGGQEITVFRTSRRRFSARRPESIGRVEDGNIS